MIPSLHTAKPSQLHVAGDMVLKQTRQERLLSALAANLPHVEKNSPMHTQISARRRTQPRVHAHQQTRLNIQDPPDEEQSHSRDQDIIDWMTCTHTHTHGAHHTKRWQ